MAGCFSCEYEHKVDRVWVNTRLWISIKRFWICLHPDMSLPDNEVRCNKLNPNDECKFYQEEK